MITSKVTKGADLPIRFKRVGETIDSAVAKTVTRLAIKMTALVKTKLSGEVLKVRTGRLRRSINYKVTKSGSKTEASVGTNVVYGKVHELGMTIPAHIVRARRGKALAFDWKGKKAFYKSVTIPTIKMPKRSFLEASLKQMTPEILETLGKDVRVEFTKVLNK